MPLYDIHCEVHGWHRDFYADSKVAMHGLPCPSVVVPEGAGTRGFWWPQPQLCGLPTGRDYSGRNENSENNHRAWWSDQLSPTGDPVYVATRGDAQHLMKARGVVPYEQGVEAAARKTKERDEARVAAKNREARLFEFRSRCTYTRNYGRTPQR